MKIYRGNPLEMDIGPIPRGIKGVLLAAIVIIILFAVYTQTSNPLNAQLSQNPLSLSANDSTILHVNVTNPLRETIPSVSVSITTPGTKQLSIYPRTQTIQGLGPQEERALEFLVQPVDTKTNPFLPGTYRVDVSTKMNGKDYVTNVFVSVVK
jgi:hypothetical protein